MEKEVTSHPGKKGQQIGDKDSFRWQIDKKDKMWKRSYQSPWHTGNGTAEQSMETQTTAAVVYNRRKLICPLRGRKSMFSDIHILKRKENFISVETSSSCF